MVKKLGIGILLALFVFSCFAGYSSGGRSGYSGGSRSYSAGRSGYSRSTPYIAPRSTYTAPRSTYRSNNTVIHNHHSYGYGGGMGGGGFFSGFLGGYLGGSMAGAHNPVVVAGGTTVLPQGQGMLVENVGYGGFALGWMLIFLLMIVVVVFCMYKMFFEEKPYNHRSKW